jgi:hypothetical protein
MELVGPLPSELEAKTGKGQSYECDEETLNVTFHDTRVCRDYLERL